MADKAEVGWRYTLLSEVRVGTTRLVTLPPGTEVVVVDVPRPSFPTVRLAVWSALEDFAVPVSILRPVSIVTKIGELEA